MCPGDRRGLPRNTLNDWLNEEEEIKTSNVAASGAGKQERAAAVFWSIKPLSHVKSLESDSLFRGFVISDYFRSPCFSYPYFSPCDSALPPPGSLLLEEGCWPWVTRWGLLWLVFPRKTCPLSPLETPNVLCLKCLKVGWKPHQWSKP